MKGHPDFSGMESWTVRSVNTLGDTPLHIAVRRGDAEIVPAMLDAGADINAKGDEGFTPLHYAVMYDDVRIVRLLLDRGADVETMSSWGESPLDSASRRRIAAVVDAIQARVTELQSGK